MLCSIQITRPQREQLKKIKPNLEKESDNGGGLQPSQKAFLDQKTFQINNKFAPKILTSVKVVGNSDAQALLKESDVNAMTIERSASASKVKELVNVNNKFIVLSIDAKNKDKKEKVNKMGKDKQKM